MISATPANWRSSLSSLKHDPEFKLQVERSLYTDSLSSYIRATWPLVVSGNLLWNWHLDAISEYLTACTTGEITRLVINVPPRSSKSNVVNVFWPTWLWGPRGHPEQSWLFASHGQELATRDSRKRRNVFRSQWYRDRWGHLVQFAPDQDTKERYQNTRKGEMISIGMGGRGIGEGGMWVIVDDPHNPLEMDSKLERQKQVTFFREVLSRRLDDKRTGVIVIIMQRLGLDDLSGYVLDSGRYTHLKLPAVAEFHEKIWFPVSKIFHERKEGELLHPAREGPEEIEEARFILRAQGFAGQYQQEPVPPGGVVFHSGWWRFYNDSTLPSLPPADPTAPVPVGKVFEQVIISLDSAYETKKENDYSVFTVWGLYQGQVYLLFVWRDRVEFPDLKRVSIALMIRWRPHALLVESKASGPPLIQSLKEAVVVDDRVMALAVGFGYRKAMPDGTKKWPPILPINPGRIDKIARAQAVTPIIENGDVFLPDQDLYDTPWFDPFILELTRFTGTNADTHDDQVDSVTQALNYIRGLGNFNIMEHHRKLMEGISNKGKIICTECQQVIPDGVEYLSSGSLKWHRAGCPK